MPACVLQKGVLSCLVSDVFIVFLRKVLRMGDVPVVYLRRARRPDTDDLCSSDDEDEYDASYRSASVSASSTTTSTAAMTVTARTTQKWTCQTCTLINALGAHTCSACGSEQARTPVGSASGTTPGRGQPIAYQKSVSCWGLLHTHGDNVFIITCA